MPLYELEEILLYAYKDPQWEWGLILITSSTLRYAEAPLACILTIVQYGQPNPNPILVPILDLILGDFGLDKIISRIRNFFCFNWSELLQRI